VNQRYLSPRDAERLGDGRERGLRCPALLGPILDANHESPVMGAPDDGLRRVRTYMDLQPHSSIMRLPQGRAGSSLLPRADTPPRDGTGSLASIG
jgi:hypothetical protein